MTSSKALHGWIVTGWIALIDLLIVATVYASVGVSESGVHAMVLVTARVSFILFLAAFAASSLRKAWPNAFTTWLLKNRRYVGVGFAFAHFVHLGTLLLLHQAYPVLWDQLVGLPLIVLGSTGYVLIALMTITSFDKTTRWLGAKRWKRLHLTGGYFILLIFALTYISRAFKDVVFLPAALAVVAVFALRMWKRRRK